MSDVSRDRYRAGKRLWSAEDDATLRARYPHEPTATIAKELRRTVSATYGRVGKLGLQKSAAYLATAPECRLRPGHQIGVATRFQPGSVPANKGLRRPGYAPGRMASTQFQPGGSLTRRPVGATRLIEGYVYRKVAAVPKVPWTRNWILEHHLVWTAAHGPIPEGYRVCFIDGDPTHTTLDNLRLVSRRDLMARNSIHTLPPEIVSTLQVLGALTRQIRRRWNAAEEQDGRSA
jgi:hypothetical protein